MKAKRSLTISFDHLLKRKSSKDDVAIGQSENKLTVAKVKTHHDLFLEISVH